MWYIKEPTSSLYLVGSSKNVPSLRESLTLSLKRVAIVFSLGRSALLAISSAYLVEERYNYNLLRWLQYQENNIDGLNLSFQITLQRDP